MRAMRIFLGFAASSAFGGAIAAGCGSSSSPSNPVDSGSGDVTTEAMPQEAAPPEAGPDVMDAGMAMCVPDTSLSTIPVPDAALGEGGATAAGCVACINMSSACQPLVMACNQSCACVSAFEAFSACISMPGGSFTACLGDLTSLASYADSGSATACGFGCAVACGFTLPSGDGGHPDASGEGGGEGGTEAGAD